MQEKGCGGSNGRAKTDKIELAKVKRKNKHI